jgi:hypothetical protein
MKQTNCELAKRESFITICKEAGYKATPRQVSKLRNKHGKVWQYLQAGKEKKKGEIK